MTTLTRRTFLWGTAGAAAMGLGRRADGAARGPQIYGVGRIGRNVEGLTVPSPSDFGFTADPTGGTFVCSMFGPATSGFLGCNIMTVQGVVTPGSLQLHRGSGSFAAEVGVFLSPNVFQPPDIIGSFGPVPCTVEVQLGGPGKATMALFIPAAAADLGGKTGGIVEFGRIERRRVRA